MAIPKYLLKILACPDDKASVKESKDKNGKYCLICQKCHRIFEVKDGIPIMLPKDYK